MSIILLGSPETDDIDAGFQYVAGQIAQKRPGLFLGRKTDAFCLIVGSPQRFEVAGGYALGLDLSTAQLAAMRDRIVELLHGKRLAEKIRRGV